MRRPVRSTPLWLSVLLIMTLLAQACAAQSLRERLAERRANRQDRDAVEDRRDGPVHLPSGVEVVRNVAYGDDPAQRMDVYRPAHAKHAPVLFMVHGGAWKVGDKSHRGVIENKIAHWVAAKGFILISTNYRMLPAAMALEQSRDVARALSTAQRMSAEWGGDPDRFILMGHSAGAHLVALLAASPKATYALGARPWLGTVALDSAAYQIETIMRNPRHFRFYDQAFGNDPDYWRQSSPFDVLTADATPLLAVCSTQRRDSCPQAQRLVAKARQMHVSANVLGEDLRHDQINSELGKESGYTHAVDAFIQTLLEAPVGESDRH